MDRYIILKPKHAEGQFVKPDGKGKDAWWDKDRGKVKGKSTLVKYVSERCTKNLPCSFRAGRRDLLVKCIECEGEFKPQD